MNKGTQILHQLPARIAVFWRWLRDGVRPTLPGALRRIGRFQPTRVRYLDESFGVVSEKGYAEALFGDAVSQASPDKPIRDAAILPSALQFRRNVPISSRILRRGRRAVGLQLTDLSPIPLEDAAFAYRVTGLRNEVEADVELSIVRKSDLALARETLDASCSCVLAGDVDTDGKPGLVFEEEREGHAVVSGLVAGVLVMACAVLAAWSWSLRFESEAELLRSEQSRLIAELRNARSEQVELEMLLAAPVTDLRLGDLLLRLAASGQDLADLETIQQLRLVNDEAVLIAGQTTTGVSREVVVTLSGGFDE